MQTVSIQIARKEARELYRAYKKHRHYSDPIDRECMRAYQLLAQGRLIIKAFESIKAAGLNAQDLPKLALCRADATACELSFRGKGSARMQVDDAHSYWRGGRTTSKCFHFPDGTFATDNWRRGVALVPGVPLYLRPKRGLANYHILWEADWTQRPPRDPYLLRRIGKSDMWLVVAMWELTEVERAALSTRITV